MNCKQKIEVAFILPTFPSLIGTFYVNEIVEVGKRMQVSVFALALLGAGILKKVPAARYAALGLFGATLLKLFFHDLASLGQLYRIGALVGVAVIAMLASLAYQRFFNALGRETRPPS